MIIKVITLNFSFIIPVLVAEIMPDGAVTFSEANDKRLSYLVQISDNQLNEYRR